MKQAGDRAEAGWIAGDLSGIAMPTHADALREGGADWLTRAFRHMGAIAPDNEVTRITRMEDCPRGSTGRKLWLSVDYARPGPTLHRDLFVKFSRAFDDPLRDRQKYEMQDEARFSALSCGADFPIDVPRCYFSDYHAGSGTGLMITANIPYGSDGIEPHHEKCMDWRLADPIEHYRAIVATNARLGAAHRAGRLSGAFDRYFPFDAKAAMAEDRIRHDARQLRNRIARFADFADAHPGLLPANIRDAGFHARLMQDVPRILHHEDAILRWLHSRSDRIVFAHWNANIDNAWFWRDRAGALSCGFIDWGRVGQMTVAQALWGSLSGAEVAIWDDHLDDLIAHYIAEFEAHGGGPRLSLDGVMLQLDMLVAHRGTCWLLDAVALIERAVPDLHDVKDRYDPRIADNELVRCQLHMLTVFLNQWQRRDFGASLNRVLAAGGGAG